MKKSRRFLSGMMALVMALALAVPAHAAEERDITILYTNDVHANFGKKITYSMVAGYRDSLGDALLLDAGDHIQNTVYGNINTANVVIDIMNAAGYNAATLGNHDFGNMAVLEGAKFDYLACNVFRAGEAFAEAYKVYEVGGKKVAVVGIATPETIAKSTPTNFMDEAGNIIFTFGAGENGAELYGLVQKAIDAAAKEADYVVALGHLGSDEGSAPYTSRDVIRNTTGLTAFIDGHSHTEMEGEEVLDKAGKTVVLTQTGCNFAKLGQMTIAADGTVTTKLLTNADLAEVEPNAEAKKVEDAFNAETEAMKSVVIGATEVAMPINDENGVRMVRKQDSAIANFCTDAFYHMYDGTEYTVDIAFQVGGNIRAAVDAGEITYQTVKTLYPWNNGVCLVRLSGQQILDALEWGAKSLNAEGTAEDGGFLNVAGLKYTVNVAIPSTVQKNEKNIWTGGPTGEYRVVDVQVLDRETGEYAPLDLNAKYNLAGVNYTLMQMGDGFNMFDGEYIRNNTTVDYLTLVEYLETFPVDEKTGLHTIKAGAGYDDIHGQGRITVVNRPADLDKNAWWYDVAVQALDARLMKGTNNGFDAEAKVTKATVFQTLYNLEGRPAAGEDAKTVTMPEGAWYTDAVNWAANSSLLADGEYAQDSVILRGEIKSILDAYCALKGVDGSGLMKGNEVGDMMLDKDLPRAEFAQILVNLQAAL